MGTAWRWLAEDEAEERRGRGEEKIVRRVIFFSISFFRLVSHICNTIQHLSLYLFTFLLFLLELLHHEKERERERAPK